MEEDGNWQFSIHFYFICCYSEMIFHNHGVGLSCIHLLNIFRYTFNILSVFVMVLDLLLWGCGGGDAMRLCWMSGWIINNEGILSYFVPFYFLFVFHFAEIYYRLIYKKECPYIPIAIWIHWFNIIIAVIIRWMCHSIPILFGLFVVIE